MTQETDVVVIGMGVGGDHVAERLAGAGLDVVGVEAELVGGECPYWACIQSKMMIRAGNLLAEARRIPRHGREDAGGAGLRSGGGPKVGDLTGFGLFTHVAMYQAETAVRAFLGEPGPDADYRALPRVAFTDPEVASVGLSEHPARQRGVRVRTGTAQVPSSARGWIHKAGNEGLVKFVEDADCGVLVGATSAGPAGAEVLYGLAVAVRAEVPVERLRHMMYAYPTFHRAVEDALTDLHRN